MSTCKVLCWGVGGCVSDMCMLHKCECGECCVACVMCGVLCEYV